MELQCRCGDAAILRTSWTERNPGRRYAECERFRAVNGCDFCFWIDPPAGEQVRQFIPGLLGRANNVQGGPRQANNNGDEVVRIAVLEHEIEHAKKREKWTWVIIAMFVLLFFFRS